MREWNGIRGEQRRGAALSSIVGIWHRIDPDVRMSVILLDGLIDLMIQMILKCSNDDVTTVRLFAFQFQSTSTQKSTLLDDGVSSGRSLRYARVNINTLRSGYTCHTHQSRSIPPRVPIAISIFRSQTDSCALFF
jgi:hypothetical protein